MKERHLGVVKWFGGYNNKTMKENNYGFVSDSSGRDIYLSSRNWHDKSLPRENDLIEFTLSYKEEKYSALAACHASSAKITCDVIWNDLKRIAESPQGSVNPELSTQTQGLLCELLYKATPADVKNMLASSAPDIFAIIKKHHNPIGSFTHIAKSSGLKITDEPLWRNLPRELIGSYEKEIADHLSQLPPKQALDKLEPLSTNLTLALTTYVIIKGIYPPSKVANRINSIFRYIKEAIAGNGSFPDYLQIAYDEDSTSHHGRLSNPTLNDILNNIKFKKSLYEKSADFLLIYGSSERLKTNLDTFILFNLFSLLSAGNSKDLVYDIFFQRLWEALTEGRIDFKKQAPKLKKLFPSCHTLPANLSCEAVYWEKQNIFLCRGKQCTTPKILPDNKKDYFEFTIYDWLAHYGINYLIDSKPASKDFPIKLAGYFNRIYEIYEAIHCNCCGNLMLPDMRYARTQYKEIENGVVVVKNMAAAYRLTVFHCNDQSCLEYGNKYYISHCLGDGCYELIDSRTSKLKCDSGRYICKGCGSCCEHHAKSNPSGLCPECGNSLQLFQSMRNTRTGKEYYAKFAKCSSAECNFKIASEDLPKKLKTLDAKTVRPDMSTINAWMHHS